MLGRCAVPAIVIPSICSVAAMTPRAPNPDHSELEAAQGRWPLGRFIDSTRRAALTARRIYTPMTFITKRRLISLVSASAIVATLAVAAAPAATLAAKPTAPRRATRRTSTASRRPPIPSARAKYAADGSMFNVTRVAANTSCIQRGVRPLVRHGQPRTAFAVHPLRAATTAPSRPRATRPRSTSTSTWRRTLSRHRPAIRLELGYQQPVRRHTAVTSSSTSARTRPPGEFVVSASNNAHRLPAHLAPLHSRSRRAAGTPSSTASERRWRARVEMSVLVPMAPSWGPGPEHSDRHHRRGGTIGGNRYGWLVTNDFANLALDNVTRISN